MCLGAGNHSALPLTFFSLTHSLFLSNPPKNVRQLAIYSSSRILGVQGRYLYTNGSEIIANVMGTNKGGDTAVISLSYGQYFASAFGEIVNNNLQTLNLVVKDVNGNSITYGPYGTSSGSSARRWSVNATGYVNCVADPIAACFLIFFSPSLA